MSYDPERITYFAKTDARGKNVPFGIKAKDRARHVYVIGKTGMGKSTMLENMAVQDIQNGEGLAFIDPHGSTAETLLDYIPEHRKKDVLYFAPFDMEHPVSFNVMEDVGADKRHLVVSGLMSTFKKIWVDAWSARMEYILSNTLLALLEYPDSTLLGVNRMLSDKVYRKKVIDNITDPAVKSFWVDEFLKYNERYMQEAGDAIKNKIGQFTANPLIRNIIGQPKSSFDIRQMMDDRKIIIMNLSKGLIGETNANLLGSMLITRIYLAAMSRADLSPQEMQKMANFYFYVDEFQSFANEAFANILSEARKYKLNLTIAHQYIEQMEEEVKNAVFGNVGTTITFRVGPFDAEVLETIFQPRFMAVDICNLGFAQVYLTLMIDGVGSQPFSAVTLPPIELKNESCKHMVIEESRQRYTHTRAEVERAIIAWHGIGTEQAQGDTKDGDDKKPEKKELSYNERKNLEMKQKVEAEKLELQKKLQEAKQTPKPQPEKNKDTDIAPRSSVLQAETKSPAVVSDTDAPKTPTNSNHTKQYPQANSAPKPKFQPKPAPKQSNATKNLEELRAVLASMSKQTKQPPTDSAQTGQKREPETKQSGQKPLEKKTEQAFVAPSPRTTNTQTEEAKKPDIKQSLAAALSEVLAQKPKKEANKLVEERVITDQQTPGRTEQSQIIHSQHNPATKQQQSQGQQRVLEKRNNLDAKELERMMRVTTNDKTPLK